MLCECTVFLRFNVYRSVIPLACVNGHDIELHQLMDACLSNKLQGHSLKMLTCKQSIHFLFFSMLLEFCLENRSSAHGSYYHESLAELFHTEKGGGDYLYIMPRGYFSLKPPVSSPVEGKAWFPFEVNHEECEIWSARNYVQS